MKWTNELTDILQVQYPIIQAPMLGATTPEMVAAISNEGGLGSLPVGGLSPEKTLALIQHTKQLTDRPFAVNLFTNDVPAYHLDEAKKMQAFLVKLCAENELTFDVQDIESFHFYNYKQQIDILINENIPIVSFTFGIIDNATIKRLHEKGIILIGTATSIKEAIVMNEKNIDLVCAQGIEAGGHRGSFLNDEPLPMVGIFALVASIADHISKPVIAAGAINNGKTIRAALALGAVGVQVGTAFLASLESSIIPAYKAALIIAADTDTQLTQAFSGRWARGIPNKMMMKIQESGLAIPPYPIQNSITTALRQAAQKQNNKDFTNLWAGQSANKVEQKSCADIFKKMVVLAEGG
ncbi:MAG: nitronate monooxygenase [Flavipsychrobacter sp.]|nr:nitronate monooxygenase [Flavipsychrobacter sp.]